MKNIMIILISYFLIGVGVFSSVDIAKAQTTTTKYLNGKIAFISNRDGPLEIYTMNLDGSNLANRTNNGASDYSPRWSPDGAKLAFVSGRDGDDEIYTMNADGSNVVQLTNSPGSDFAESWSPDGSKIAFTRGSSGIYTMNADGSNVVQLSVNPVNDSAPDWSPDGSKIAFKTSRDGNAEIYTMNVDGSNLINITNNPANEQSVNWSPDGSKFTFWSDRDGNAEIYTMNADGSNVVRLTNNVYDDRAASWSPDGKKILFTSGRDSPNGVSPADIYMMNTDGSNQERITFDVTTHEFGSSWQPLPYTVTINDDGTTTSVIAADENYPTTDYTVVSGETLVLNGTLCDVSVQSGGTLIGSGTACSINIESGATISPGQGPGCLVTGDLTISGFYLAELAGTTACSSLDQLQATGSVSLTGSTLTPSLLNGFVPAAGDSFTIITNDATDPIAGTFAGLPEGATVTIGGVIFKISYQGGSGNDVTLTAQTIPVVPETGWGDINSNITPLLYIVIMILSAATICLAAHYKIKKEI